MSGGRITVYGDLPWEMSTTEHLPVRSISVSRKSPKGDRQTKCFRPRSGQVVLVATVIDHRAARPTDEPAEAGAAA